MNRQLKEALKVGAIVVIPGAWAFWLVRKIIKDLDERNEFKEYVRKTYGRASNYVERT